MQGRVFTLVGSIAALMSPLGLMVAGPLSDTIGVRAWFIVGGITMVTLGAVCFFLPAALQLEERRPAVESQPPAEETAAVAVPAD